MVSRWPWELWRDLRVVVRSSDGSGSDHSATDYLGTLTEIGAHQILLATNTGPVSLTLGNVIAAKVVPPASRRGVPSHLNPSATELTRIAAAHWHGTIQERQGPWLLQAANRFTLRANSALVWDPQVIVDDPYPWITTAQSFAATHEILPQIHLPEDPAPEVPSDARDEHYPGVRAYLTQQGWHTPTPTIDVLTGNLNRMMASHGGASEVIGHSKPTDGWLESRAQFQNPAALTVLLSAERQNFLSVVRAGSTIATARVSIAHGWAGLSAVWVDPQFRGQGLGTALTNAAIAWAKTNSASSLFLQVAAENTGAQRLYTSVGMVRHHSYRYWTPSQIPSAN